MVLKALRLWYRISLPVSCGQTGGCRRVDPRFALAVWTLTFGPLGGLDINDDAELHVDEIIVGVSEECRPLVSSGPLGRRRP